MIEIEWINNNTNQIIYIIKIFIFSLYTYYISIRLLNIKKYLMPKYSLLFLVSAILVVILATTIDRVTGINVNSIFCVIILTAISFSVITKNKLGYSILINAISLSINQILFFISILIGFIIYQIIGIKSEYLNFLIIIFVDFIIIKLVFKIKKIRNGVAILKKNRENQYFNMIILNISWVIIFLSIVIDNYKANSTSRAGIGFILFAIIMIVTIQKSLQLYYKQKMLVKDLEETKTELEEKKKEIEELEKENLNFSKVTHSIAHKQKSLEFKLNELNMKSEISSEIGDRIDKLGKELTKETISVIEKVGIEEIDDMLKYMQAECVKKKIDFQLQISGNIHTMINHYIDKEELEILLADHIKNAIIAIGCGDNVNKSILVRLGKLDGYYGLYIYDSGIEFEIETLYKLGKIPATTHKDNGGTGMGFMNTFDTLRKHKASLVIEEYGKPVKNNFTKALKFIFNGKSEFKIFSYRNEKIEKENKENDLVVEKLNI